MDLNRALRLDEELSGRRAATGFELAELRWHWTRDEQNPERVSGAEYARRRGISRYAVNVYARCHQERLAHPDDSFSACLRRARVRELPEGEGDGAQPEPRPDPTRTSRLMEALASVVKAADLPADGASSSVAQRLAAAAGELV